MNGCTRRVEYLALPAPSGVFALTNALVHHSVIATPLVRERHATFIAKRLAVSFGCLAVAPFFAAFRGAPTAGEILVFACSFAPLAAAVVAARTGRLVAAHAIAYAGLVMLSFGLWLGLGCGTGCVIAWLIAARLEASLAGDRRLATVATIVTGAALIAISGAALVGISVPSASPSVAAVFAGLALAYALIVATGAWQAPAPRRHTSDDNADLWRLVGAMSNDLVMRFDATGTALTAVDGAETILGATSAHVLGRGIFDHVHIMDRPAFLKQIGDAAHGLETTHTEVRLRTAQGTHKWFELRACRLGTRLPVEVAVLLRDNEAAHARDAEVAGARATVDEALQAKDHFLANVGHELRTPLNAIIGFSEMLASRTLRPSDPEKQREYARIIHQSGQHLLSIVSAILDVSKIRSGTFALAIESFEIAPLVDLCCEMVALKAEAGGVHLIRDPNSAVGEVIGDKRAYKQILINLLSNAVKFTPREGTVTVGITAEADAMMMRVADTGVGIAAEDLARLGDPFFQAQVDINRPVEGTGLGLSVVRGLVGLLGGTIAIDSAIGRGTCVTIRIPTQAAAPKSRGPATIHAITPHTASEPAFGRQDQRMKDIA